MFWLQQMFNGITQGSIYALMAIGYSIILGIIGLVTFVHGEVIMIGAFAGFFMVTFLKANFFLAVLAGFAASWLLGIIIERICYRPFRSGPREIALIATIGLSILLRSLSQVTFGTEQKLMPDLLNSHFITLGQIRITNIQLLIIFTVFILALLLHQFFYKTKTGIALRAVSMNKQAAALLGVHVNRTILLGNALGCALGGVSGVLLGIYYNSVHPVMGASVAMKAFTATVFGGIGSIPGAALGGILLGIFENLGVAIFSSGYRDIISFSILILILLIRPQGILGRKELER